MDNLSSDDLRTLGALAEVAVGPDMEERVPDYAADIDDFLHYLAPATRKQVLIALRALRSGFWRILVIGFGFGFRSFHDMSVQERTEFLEKLKASNRARHRDIYAGLVGLMTTAFYGERAIWSDELDYEGVSVDNQRVLDNHRWRPDDPRPVPPCVKL